ncbi:SUMF1/EgtB/PvdO family nonheme iron enzyme [Rhizobium sp. S152]|uniref:SUMF1/EgtB/PvdO family nonheme iron enzyme n=1 Tax=Rhizobium sp. S152 TaxID=3055038 RepID=UPI0025A9D82E|nr:SUMF1/EgtB/PvdO family nonheme iron enzyme [Rhizobium sp. S152]MDM9629068.1 SUMF1/EgtB/PvdO family nonheme iron enzyme [Rhizobium sp. S152]
MSENWAICVGINRYDNIKSLGFAKQDAEAVAGYFRRSAKFNNIYLFGEGAEPIEADFGHSLQATPTFINLRRFLRVRFDQPFLRPSDNLWFFFAGHGKRSGEQDYLLPMDVDPGNVDETGIPVRYVVERLRRSGAGNVVMLLDACRNEGARDGQGAGLEKLKGTVTLSSCSASEFSYEIPELGHGAFTYGLLEALELRGEHNCATVERLDSYLQTRVPEICRLYGKPVQTPCTFAEPLSKRKFILLPSVAVVDDLEPLKLEAYQAEESADLALADQLWWRVLTVDPGDALAQSSIRRIAAKLQRIDEDDVGERSNVHDPATSPRTRQLDPTNKFAEPALGPSRRQVLTGLGIGSIAVAGVAAGVVQWRTRNWAGKAPPINAMSTYVDVKTVNAEGKPLPTFRQRIRYFAENIDDQTTFEMSLLPGGEFQMGAAVGEWPAKSAESRRMQPLRIAPFAMSRTVVTQQQWLSVYDGHPETLNWPLSPDPSSFKGGDQPVETVSWQEATEFCARLSNISRRRYRLPSEAEWEYACRAGTTTAFHFGPTLTDTLANYCGDGGAVCGTSFEREIASTTYDGIEYPSGTYAGGPPGVFRGKPTPVASYPPNGFGLFDMHGNVWEHCLDRWSPRLDWLPSDGSAFDTEDGDNLRALRGGAWSHNPALCRSASRDRMAQDSTGWEGRVGFRVVCELEDI